MSGRNQRAVVFLLLLCLLPIVFRGASDAGTLTLPAKLTAVPAEVFCDDHAIDTVVLPDSVTEIGSRAFAGSSLKEITIPAAVETIADDAFEDCEVDMLHITVRSAKAIRKRMFYQNDWFSTVVIEDGLEVIEAEAFTGSSLTKLSIPASVKEIASDAFTACPLVTLTIVSKGRDSRIIHEGLFRGQQALASVVIESGLTTIEAEAFAGSSLKEVTIPSTVTQIAEDAFTGCPLEDIHVTKGSYAYDWMRDRGYIREYRALLIGEQRFLREDGEGFYTELANRNKNDVNQLMKPALGRTIGPSGVYGANEGHFIITTKINLAYGQIKTAIQTAFRDTRDQDISVFFIATHGNSAGDGELEMAFTGDPNKPDQVRVFSENQLLPMSTLAGWLREYVRGKVFVILESCGAGSAIYPADNGSKALKASKTNRGTSADDEYDPKAFVSEAVAVFSKADPGLTEPDGTEEGLRKDSTGDMKVGKFYVLAAAAHHEMSYGWEAGDASFNFFTKWLTDGIGRKGSSPADRNGDEKLTLQELYSYIKNVGDDYISSHFEGNPDQHVQCWPANSSVALLRLK